jgi:RNA polymerase sigma factor (sigma-70 family)
MSKNAQRSQRVPFEVRELYERHGPQLRFFLQRQLRLKHKVEDLLHDVFECLLKYPCTEPLRKPDHYLWRIAWRLVNAANRRLDLDQERMAKAGPRLEDWVLGRASLLAPPDVAEWLAYQEEVRRCLERLSPEERNAVILARFGCSYREIGAEMNLRPEAVRRLLRHSYLFLKVSSAAAEKE